MTEQDYPEGAAVLDATKASSPTAALLDEMRRVGTAGKPVSADQVQAWTTALIEQLYSAPVRRWESRHKKDHQPGCWSEADTLTVFYAHSRGRVVRALFDRPVPVKPRRPHTFDPVTHRCRTCRLPSSLSSVDCEPPPPPRPDPRTVLPFKAVWLIEPLEKLLYLTKFLPSADARKWRTETEFLLEKLRTFIAETKP